MLYKTIPFTLFLLCTLAACKKDKAPNPYSDIADLQTTSNISELGNYASLFDKMYNGTTKIRLSKNFGETYEPTLTAWYLEGSEQQYSPINGGNFQINELVLSASSGTSYQLENAPNREELTELIQQSLLGKDATFKHFNTNNELVFEEVLRIPDELQISGNNGEPIPNTNYYRMDRNNCLFSYLVDDENINGLLVLLSWGGDMYRMTLDDFEDIEPQNIFRTVLAKNESGTVEIPSELFSDIPTNAIVTLWIARGNNKVFSKDGKDFRLSALTEQQFRLVIE